VRPCRAAHCAHHPFYKKLPLHAEDTQISGDRALEDRPSSKHLWLQVLYSLCPWARMSGLSTFVHAPFSYKREACSATKGIQSQAHSDTHKFIQALKQYITQWSRVLRSGGPNHSKPSRALVCSSTNLVTSKTLRPLLFLGFRADAIRHPAGEISSPTFGALGRG
jgi:hypothetical protein